MRLPRMTTRRYLLLVTLVGLVMGPVLGLLRFLQNPYFDSPRYLRVMRENNVRLDTARAHFKEAARSSGKKARYHLMMKDKWEEAASNFVDPVEPDPPPPVP